MASSSSSSSLSSSVHPQEKHEIQQKYDVFLSFRGEDTRKGFASYLYAALSANQILTFMDDHELERGDEISPTLIKAIEESKISVIIFSENYASSTWCLDELLQILECRRTNGQIVMPIFYGVHPSIVRKQKGSYGVAFAELENRFMDKMEKVKQWRAALTEGSNLCGLDSKDFRLEPKLVEKIVEDISLKLPKIFQPSNELYKVGLIGIEKRIKEIKSLLSIGSKDIRIIGIWGMGGNGKTTLAEVVYEELSNSQFDGCCSFLPNVTKKYARHGPSHLRKKLLSQLVNDKDILNTPFVTSSYVLDKLRSKKVLIVLDDVSDSIQLDSLIKGYNQLALGSRIIVTTRDKQVLMKAAHRIYKVEGLSHNESLELFRLHALRENSSTIDDEMLLERATSYAAGNPLALKVLGSFLCSKDKEDWESVLCNLQKFPDQHQILNVLRVSYEGLDKWTQNIFLDMACLFDGSFTRNEAERLLDNGDSLVKIRMDILIEKSLIEDHGKYSIDNKLWMHDLLRQMGCTIVRDGGKEPGNRSRLYDSMEVCEVLENSMGTTAVEVISLDMSEMKKNVEVCHGAFSNMINLRILKVYYGDDDIGRNKLIHIDWNNISSNKFKLSIPQGLDSYLSTKLTFLRWDLYPWKSLPSNFIPKNLVELVLRGSHVEKLWNNSKVQSFPVLRRIDLSYSKCLTQLPDLSESPNLESINLEGCRSLVQVLLSLQNLNKLTYLNLNGCSKLRDLEDISKRTEGYLDVVRFRGIKNVLNNFPFLKSCIQRFIGNLRLYSSQAHISQKFAPNLRYLNLSKTAIETVPPSIWYLSGLVRLDLSDCTRLKSLPTSICHLKSLESLYLNGCEKLKTFPEILEPMKHLEYLTLGYSGIKELPESIENLVSLEVLCLYHCKDLERLHSLPPSLLELLVYDCERLKSLPEVPSQCTSLCVNRCTSLENILNWRAPLLRDLDITKWKYNIRNDHCFYNCEKLDQNTRNMLADRAEIHILFRLTYPSTGFSSTFYYPGDEIPKWFNYQTCGTSINNIMLPPDWNSDNFLGFAFCIVFHVNPNIFDISFVVNFTTIDDDSFYQFYDSVYNFGDSNNSDHVYIWHGTKNSLNLPNKWMDGLDWPSKCSTGASFHVYNRFKDTNGRKYGEIKKFGVRFVYKEDRERCDAETERKNKRRFNECCESSGSEPVGSLEEEHNDESHS